MKDKRGGRIARRRLTEPGQSGGDVPPAASAIPSSKFVPHAAGRHFTDAPSASIAAARSPARRDAAPSRNRASTEPGVVARTFRANDAARTGSTASRRRASARTDTSVSLKPYTCTTARPDRRRRACRNVIGPCRKGNGDEWRGLSHYASVRRGRAQSEDADRAQFTSRVSCGGAAGLALAAEAGAAASPSAWALPANARS